MLEKFSIADILTWLDDKTLVLNVDFQRRSVWPPAARAYLIDTILRGRPIPLIYLRTMTDPKTRRSYREVVDGQQRLRAIQDFADGKFALGTSRTIFGDYAGVSYGQLDEETQRNFLSYSIGVEQLFNAKTEDVLDVFHRINAYGLDVNAQELRHGKYTGAFRSAVVEASKKWSVLWEKYKVISVRARVRMADDELMAQMFGVLLEGVVDGGQRAITKLYVDYDKELSLGTTDKVDAIIEFLIANFPEILETGMAGAPHFLMLFAALAHALFGIPRGGLKEDEMPERSPEALSDIAAANANLGVLADVLVKDISELHDRFKAFKFASAGSTQRIKSRKVRFPLLYSALLPQPL